MLWGLRRKKKQQKNPPPNQLSPRSPGNKQMQNIENNSLFYVVISARTFQRATKHNSALISGNFELDSFLSSIKFHQVYNDINAELSR